MEEADSKKDVAHARANQKQLVMCETLIGERWTR